MNKTSRDVLLNLVNPLGVEYSIVMLGYTEKVKANSNVCFSVCTYVTF